MKKYLLKANTLCDIMQSDGKRPNSIIKSFDTEEDALKEADRMINRYPVDLGHNCFAHLVQLRIYEQIEY